MEKEYIVIIVLLVLIVLMFLAIAIAVVVGVAKVQKVTRPIQNTIRAVRTVRKLRRTPSKTKREHRSAQRAAQNLHKAAKQVRTAIQSDLKLLQKRFANSKIPIIAPNLSQLIIRGFNTLTGSNCAQWEPLWINHIDLTYYYGVLALRKEISEDDQKKMDYTAGELLKIQEQMAQLLKPCVADPKELTNLLKEHITIVAQIATEWRKQPSGGFNGDLVRKWYQNAAQTVALLRAPKEFADTYRQHLDDTAAYLTSLANSSDKALDEFQKALHHAPELARVFCSQMQSCEQ